MLNLGGNYGQPGSADLPNSPYGQPGLNFSGTVSDFTNQVLRYSNAQLGDQFPSEGTELVNAPIVYSYTIFPWKDKTHEWIQENMYVFIQRHIEKKYRVVNMAPVWRLNVEFRQAWGAFSNDYENAGNQERDEFQRYMAEFGEEILLSLHNAIKKDGKMPDNVKQDLKRYYELAQKKDYMYLTKFGILHNWFPIGTVLSKMESTGAGSWQDMHTNTDILYNVGVVVGQVARINNYWGGKSTVKQGTRLYWILHRVMSYDREGRPVPGQYELLPWASAKETQPPQRLLQHTDESGRIVRRHAIYVGQVWENRQKEPSQAAIDESCGLIGNAESAYRANGAMPWIRVLLGI